ncbi:hypothetical protein GCM10007880_67690 [Mesorhizobium amorphae]|nr:hypothetical protein GCM10007880_67690 [Mesorhizobium amorphae]
MANGTVMFRLQVAGIQRSAADARPPRKSKLYVRRPEHGTGLLLGMRTGVDRENAEWLTPSLMTICGKVRFFK